MLGDVDLVIVEGYKKGPWPKIEVFHQGVAHRPPIPGDELLAVVSDEPPGTGAPWFNPEDAAGAADLIEQRIIKNEGY